MNKKKLALFATICLFLLFILFNKQMDTTVGELNTKSEKLNLEFKNEIIIAVVDSGLDIYNFDSLEVVKGYNATSDSDPIDHLGHGTKVTNIIAESLHDILSPSKIGNFKIMPVKVFDDVGKTSDKYITDGIYEAVNRGANVINLSFKTNKISKEFLDVIQYAIDDHVVVVMCAIDKLDTSDEFNIISKLPVIWVDSSEQEKEASNTKNERLLTIVTTPYKDNKGASFAVPQVSSTVAVMLGLKLNQSYEIKDILSKTASNKLNGVGLLNITGAIENN